MGSRLSAPGPQEKRFAASMKADGQHPDEMALTASTNGAAGAMADAAAEQGATKDLFCVGRVAASLARALRTVSCFISNNETQSIGLVNPFRNKLTS